MSGNIYRTSLERIYGSTLPFGPLDSWYISLYTKKVDHFITHTAPFTQTNTLESMIKSFADNFIRFNPTQKIVAARAKDWNNKRIYFYKMYSDGTLQLLSQIPSLKKLAYLSVVATGQKTKLQEMTHIEDFDDCERFLKKKHVNYIPKEPSTS